MNEKKHVSTAWLMNVLEPIVDFFKKKTDGLQELIGEQPVSEQIEEAVEGISPADIGAQPAGDYALKTEILPAIVDVTELPETDIREDVFYRVLTGTVYYDMMPYVWGSCHVVETLPETGEPATDANMQMINAYYAIDTESASGYLPSELASAFGLPAGWYPVGALLQAAQRPYGGIVYSREDMTKNREIYILIEGFVQHNDHGVWRSGNGVGWHGRGEGAEIFNSLKNFADGYSSHAEGSDTMASGGTSHAEGFSTTASGDVAHAEGYYTKATGFYSHAEGGWSEASGEGAHAEGRHSEAKGFYSHAEGQRTIAAGRSQHVQGEYNIVDENEGETQARGKYAHIVGNGTSESNRSNAHTLDWDGNAYYAGDVYVQGNGANDFSGAKKLATESSVEAVRSSIPTKVSALTNDSGYLTEHQDLTAYATKTYADNAVSTHNVNTSAHNDIRDLISGLSTRLNALADSDDTTLDQMSEIVAYIKANKGLIDSVTTSKVNTADIVDNLTTNVATKPLSAAQGVALKALVDGKAAKSDLIGLATQDYVNAQIQAAVANLLTREQMVEYVETSILGGEW